MFERFRGILQEGTIDKRVQYTIENLFAVWKSKFADYPSIPETLDLVEKEDKITLEMSLDETYEKEEVLDVFKFDPNYLENEKAWKEIKKVRKRDRHVVPLYGLRNRSDAYLLLFFLFIGNEVDNNKDLINGH